MGFNGTRAQMMEEAINKLKFYYGVKSKEDFYLAAITGDKTGEETKEGSEALADPEAAANTFKGMTNLMDGGMIMKDILGSFQDLATSAKTDKEAQSMLDALRRSFIVVGGLKGTSTTEERKKEDQINPAKPTNPIDPINN